MFCSTAVRRPCRHARVSFAVRRQQHRKPWCFDSPGVLWRRAMLPYPPLAWLASNSIHAWNSLPGDTIMKLVPRCVADFEYYCLRDVPLQ